MSNTSFRFRHTFLLSACSSQGRTTSCSSLMSYHQVNNKCNKVKRTALKMVNLCSTLKFQIEGEDGINGDAGKRWPI